MKKILLITMISLFIVFVTGCSPSPGGGATSYSLTSESIRDYGGSSHSYSATLKNTTDNSMHYTVWVRVYSSSGEQIEVNYAEYNLSAGSSTHVVISLSFISTSYTFTSSVNSREE